jgi:hypothetical protein
MDFATFAKIANLMKLYINNDSQTMGFLSYRDLLYVGKYVQTYRLLQNITELVVKNDILLRNLNKGVRMENLILTDGDSFVTYNGFDIRDNNNRIGLDKLFVLYRYFEMLEKNEVNFPFAMNYTQYSALLTTQPLMGKLQDAILNSFQGYQNFIGKAGLQVDINNYTDYFIRTIDLNNNTLIEPYELLLAHEAVCIFYELTGGKNNLEKFIDEKLIRSTLLKYNDFHILSIDSSNVDYLTYVIIFL